jgi:GNAT superfamily N-acetyltransferase
MGFPLDHGAKDPEMVGPMDEVAVRRLAATEAHHLAPLLAAYTQERKRGGPREPDQLYAETLLKDPVAEFLGAWQGDRLVGFTAFLDIPEPMSGLRAGQLEELFVLPAVREHGVGRVLVDAVIAEGRRRNWTHLRWMVPDKPPAARKLAEKLADRGDWESYVVRFERRGLG